MLPLHCPNCGWYVSKPVAYINGLMEITRVDANCKRCGVVHPDDWEYDDFEIEKEYDLQL